MLILDKQRAVDRMVALAARGGMPGGSHAARPLGRPYRRIAVYERRVTPYVPATLRRVLHGADGIANV